jgi:hypothetical protein
VKETFIPLYDYVVEFSYYCPMVLMSIHFDNFSLREVIAINDWREPNGNHLEVAPPWGSRSSSHMW